MENFKIDYEFTLQDFEDMERIEHQYFANENITKAEEVLNWYNKNKFTCVGVRNENDKVIASVNILPLKKDTFIDIYENKINEADVVAEQIERYEDNKEYYMYLSSISIDKSYRNNYKLVLLLLKGCMELFDIIDSKNIKVNKLMADASTIHGEKICKKLLNMKFVTNTSHCSKIYCIDGDNLNETFIRLRKLVSKV